MTPSQKGLQGIPTRFLRRFWLTERATPSQKHLQGTIIRSVNFGLGNNNASDREHLAQKAQRVHYSFFNSVAGFVFAALRVCQMTDARESITFSRAAATNIHQ